MAIPKRVEDRLRASLKVFTPILTAQRNRDVSEADTVTLVKDLLADLFGYDKYAEVTSEHAVRGTFCDLAIRVEDKLRFLIEVKAIGLQLNDRHIKQAVDYGTNQGVEWVVLTNGVRWTVYHLLFKKPIEAKLVADFDLLTMNLKNDSDLEKLFLLTREGLAKGALAEFRHRQGATDRFLLAAILTHSELVTTAIRREVRRITDMLVDPDTISMVLREEVLKRETREGPEAIEAVKRVNRGANSGTKNTPPPAEPPSTVNSAENRPVDPQA